MDGAAVNPLVVLGATGSIGRQTLEVADRLEIPVAAVAARRGSDELLQLALQYPEADVAVAAPTGAEREHLTGRLGARVGFGAGSLVDLAGRTDVTVVNGVVGAAGLAASVAALEAGNRLALANKESLVAGGPVLKRALEQGGGELLPVDSEHSALLQCLTGEDLSSVARLILTASGGPFRGRDAGSMASVTVAEALAHPTWSMGPRITIDSATLMNKAFEVIEAHLLFDLPYDQIDVVVHPQSIVHSLVEFEDGSLKAHLGEPDMRVPIQYAITHPARRPGPLAPFPLAAQTLTFEPPDRVAFPLLDIGYEAGRQGDSAPAVLNAADEIAVQAFLDGRIGFSAIPRVVAGALERVPLRKLEQVADVVAVDEEARSVASELAGTC
ncbi:MAG: 1-deoxy-D-xylulose-5-phosphate reductoisomerase [Acidimicrobiia bacterium]